MIDISIIIPVYNGSQTIASLVHSIARELSAYDFEIVLVNDGSKDRSAIVCLELSESLSFVTFVDLRKNFGEFNAVLCGLRFSKGNYSVIIDDDFQNPPSEIIKLYQKAVSEDYDVVYSYYEEKKHHWFRNLGSKAINLLTTYLLRKPKDLYLSSFKIIKSEVVTEIVKSLAPHPYIDGLIFQVTQNVGKQLVTHNKREEGTSNYTLNKLVGLTLNIIFGYSLLPLRLTFLVGFLSIIFALGYMALYGFNLIEHWGSPIIIFMCGVILCCFALIGEYIGNMFLIATGKPQYSIKAVYKNKESRRLN